MESDAHAVGSRVARKLLRCEPMGKKSRVLCQSVPTFTIGPALFVSAALFTVGSWTEVADACSYLAPPPELVGYPKESDTQVPIDVVPFYDTTKAGIYGGSRTAVFSMRSSTGTVVEVALSDEHHWAIELTPRTALEPDTSYTLEATLPVTGASPVTRSVTFTTGSQRASAPLPPSGAFIQHYRFTGSMTTCDPPPIGSCVAFEEGPLVAS